MLPAKDISRYQGIYQDTGEPIIMVKISGGDQGLYIDPQASANYKAVLASGKAFGGYHYAGGTNPIAEANYFIQAMQPLNPGEVPALDWEVSNPDPVKWVNQFVTHVHDLTNTWPLVYLNLSTLNAYDWSPVLNNCGLWLADWNNNPQGTIQTNYTYVMQQYSDGPDYDHDEWYGTLEEFKKYGWPQPVIATPPPITVSGSVTDSGTTTTESTTSTTITTTTTLPPKPPTNIDGIIPVSTPKPVQKPSNEVVVVEHDVERFVITHYNKTLVAVGGLVLTFLNQYFSGNTAIQEVITVLTALGVFQIPNTKK